MLRLNALTAGLAAATVLVISASAQSFTARIVGTVTDAGGAVVPGAEVTVLDVDTNRSFNTTTNDIGNYAVAELNRGNYQIEVVSTGFKQFIRRGIQLSVGQQTRIDVRLEVGNVAESIEVVADASLLEAVDSALGKVVDNKRIIELPLNTRNVFSLLYLTPE